MNKIKRPFSTLENALRILNAFSSGEPKYRLSDLETRLELSKSTVQRLMATLVHEGFVARDVHTNEYRLSVSILSLARVLNRELEHTSYTLPYLKELTRQTGESSHIAILEQDEVVFVQRVECELPVRHAIHPGMRYPASSFASGIVLVAGLDPARRSQLMKRWKKNPANCMEQCLVLVEKAVAQSYAVTVDHEREHIFAVSSPIMNSSGNIVAAVGISGPLQRYSDARLKKLAGSVTAAGKRISAMLAERGDESFL